MSLEHLPCRSYGLENDKTEEHCNVIHRREYIAALPTTDTRRYKESCRSQDYKRQRRFCLLDVVASCRGYCWYLLFASFDH
jgi:hypothetical protein